MLAGNGGPLGSRKLDGALDANDCLKAGQVYDSLPDAVSRVARETLLSGLDDLSLSRCLFDRK